MSEVAERFDTGKEKIGASLDGSEGRQSGDFLADGTLGNFKFKCSVLAADDRIAFIAEFVKVTVVCPYVLGELELAFGASESGRRPMIHSAKRDWFHKEK